MITGSNQQIVARRKAACFLRQAILHVRLRQKAETREIATRHYDRVVFSNTPVVNRDRLRGVCGARYPATRRTANTRKDARPDRTPRDTQSRCNVEGNSTEGILQKTSHRSTRIDYRFNPKVIRADLWP